MLYVEVNAKRPGTASMEYAVDRSDTIIIGFVWTLIDQIFLLEAYERFIAFIILVFILCNLF